MQKYFIPFLLASLQRLTLESMAGEASAIVHSAKRNASEIGALRQLFLQFRLNGYFSRISSREVVQRYYRLCRQGLDVEASMAALDDAFAEIDARQASDLQLQLSRDMERNLSAMVRLQGSTDAHLHLMEGIQVKLEIVEILIFFVYGAELGHLLLPESHSYGMGLLFVLGGSGALGTLGWLLMWPSWHHYMKHRRTRVHADPMRPELAESATSEASRIGKPGTTGSMTAAAPDGIQHEMQPAAGTIGNGIEARIPPESRGK